MDLGKVERLRAQGWRMGHIGDFLGLGDREVVQVELKMALARGLRLERELRRLTRPQLAERIGTTREEVAALESAEPEVSLERLVWALRTLEIIYPGLAELVRATRIPE